jgi:hypothetical protein
MNDLGSLKAFDALRPVTAFATNSKSFLVKESERWKCFVRILTKSEGQVEGKKIPKALATKLREPHAEICFDSLEKKLTCSVSSKFLKYTFQCM